MGRFMTTAEVYEAYQHLVRPIAARVARSLPGQCLEDLEQTGRLALVQAARRYDPQRRDMFPIYARLRIRGAILDSLSRSRRLASGDEQPEASEPGANPEECAWLREIAAAVARLTYDQQLILDLHYQRGLSLRAAGRAAGVSATQARRHEAAALAELRKWMGVAA